MTRATIVCGVLLASGWARADNVVRGIDVREHGDRTEVLVRGGAAPTFTTYKLDRPTRVVVDIANTHLDEIDSPMAVDTWAVSQVAAQEFQSDDRAITRVMVALKRECAYDARAEGKDVRIVLTPAAPRPGSTDGARAEREKARAQAALAERDSARAEAERAEAQAREALAAAERERKAAEAARREADEARRAADEMRRAASSTKAEREAAEKAKREADRQRQEAEKRLARAERALQEAEQAKDQGAKTKESAGRDSRDAKQDAGKARAEKARGKKEAAKAPKGPAFAEIVDVSFGETEESAAVTVRMRGKAQWSVLPTDGKTAMLELRGAKLDPSLERKMDTSGFTGPVRAISTYRVDESEGRVRLVAELDGDPTHHVSPTGEGLRWVFAKSTASKATSYAPQRVGAFSSAPLAAAMGRSKRGGQYSGRRIDLDFKDADIQNLLRLLSDVGEVNIVTSDDVKGEVTIRMRNVPWDQALDVILRSKSLGQVREGNLIRVAPLSVLQKERDEEIARLKQIEELKPIETRLVPLSYAKAADVVQRATDFLSARGKVSFDERTNQIVARDTADRLDVIEQLVRELDTQTPQVTIEARIIEANTNFVRELGVQWGGDITSSAATGNPTGLVFPNELGVGGSSFTPGQPQLFVPGAPNPNFAVNLPAGAGEGRGGSVGLHMGSVSGAFNLNLRLSAAEDTDQVRILSAPKVTTLDNHKATITSGVTIPFSTVSAQGTQTTFQDAVLGLTVTPHVAADGSVVLDLDISKSEPGAATPQGQVTITKKTAKTEMLVKDGDTAVIGGIYTRTTGTVRRKVPWFAELPIFGYFFRHSSERDNRSEVLVFITPRIVNRAVALGR